MQAYCDEHGLALRPHIKTHKLPELARLQLDAGACGITCQKLGEAEVMADAGSTTS
jgi:Predicted amino acid aldolase or racemase